MRKIAILAGIGAAALLAAPSANAAPDAAKSQDQSVKVDKAQPTDVSSRRVHRRYYRHVYRPYYGRSYAYAPRPYYSQPYYSSGPSVSFSFGGGGYRQGYGGWGHRW